MIMKDAYLNKFLIVYLFCLSLRHVQNGLFKQI